MKYTWSLVVSGRGILDDKTLRVLETCNNILSNGQPYKGILEVTGKIP